MQGSKFGWFSRNKRNKRPASFTSGPREDPQAKRNVWRRLFDRVAAGSNGPVPETNDPTLAFAREWVAAHHGTSRVLATNVVRALYADGRMISYSNAPHGASDSDDQVILAPGFAARDELLDAAMARGTGLHLRLSRGPFSAADLARRAFVVREDGRSLRAAGAFAAPESRRREPGQRVIYGGGKLRNASIVNEAERIVYEFTFRVRVKSVHGRHEEITRIALDADSSTLLPPLDTSALSRAVAAPGDEVRSGPSDAHLRLATASIEPVAQAAGKLARIQSLADYERRVYDIDSTLHQALMETPECAPALLQARAQHLEWLAEAYAINVETELVNVVTLVSHLTHVRLAFARRGQLIVAVDTSREAVIRPVCESCGRGWDAAAMCADGHITCMECRRICSHCGSRHCLRCEVSARQTCPQCNGMMCARCASAVAKGRHNFPRQRVYDPAARSNTAGASSQQNDAQPVHLTSTRHDEPEATVPNGDELQVTDLDVMSQATWDRLIRWLVENAGWRVSEPRDGIAPDTLLHCVVIHDAPAPDSFMKASFPTGTRVVVATHRAGTSLSMLADSLKRAIHAASMDPDLRLVLITNAEASVISSSLVPNGKHLVLIARDELARLLHARSHAHALAQSTAATENERRAHAAGVVRTELVAGLRACQVLLLGAALVQADGLDQCGTTPPSSLMDNFAVMTTIANSLGTTKQALAALETLIEEWEGAFSASPTRAATQAISMEVPAFEALADRGRHLIQILHDACSVLSRIEVSDDPTSAWLSALRDEIDHHCASLVLHCEALNPAEWRHYGAVRDQSRLAESVSELSASSRAALRAQTLQPARTVGNLLGRDHGD